MAKATQATAAGASKYETKDDATDASADTGTAGTPEGAGTAYTDAAADSDNTNGKASATAAGGDPVNSPVTGNPGETRTDMAYDYGLAGAPSQASQPLASVEALKATATPDPRDMLIALLQQQLAAAQSPAVAAVSAPKAASARYARRVRALRKGHYNGIREVGEKFDNELNLPTYPEDQTSWFEAAE